MEEPRVGSRQNDTTTKRRSGKRTARACDECRMRKSKCDGLQPCESCQNTERYCTYNLSASKSTGSGTRIRILEDRLRRARAYLNEAQRRTPSLSDINFDALLGPTEDYARDDATKTGSGDDDDGSSDEKLDSMMNSYGQMTNNSQESMARDYYGAASGLAWLQRTKQFFSEKSTEENSDSRNPSISTSAAIQIFDAPLPPKNSYTIDEPVPRLLPPRAVATRLLDVVFTQVYPLFHFLDMDDFQISTTRIYELDPIEYEERDKAFLPLFWLVIGLGYLFSRDEHAKHGCKTAVAHAMRQFLAGRQLLDLAHLRTIVSLQSVICLILFLISTARIASAHAFVGVACAAAMRQGLHYRSNHETSIPERERHVRQRVFWAVIALDMYVSGILGLPAFVDLSAVDPAIDLTIEIALKEFREAKHGTAATRLSSAASAKHIELMRILKKAQTALYPRPNIPPESLDENPPIKVKVAKLREVEDQFQEWARSLSEIHAVPGTDEETISIKYEAQITYYFANVVLLRAFLHYLALEKEDPSAVGKRQLSYAKTCVKMASKVVSISINHQQQGLLCPASWPSVYTVFISVVCLLFAYAVRAGNTESKALRIDIENGIRLLASTACTTDTGSVRCLEILRRLIEKVSHKVTIDLDQICSDTKPCCAARFDSPSSGTDTTGLEQDDPVHINATTSQPPNNVAATSQTQWANMYDVNTFPASVSNESAMDMSAMDMSAMAGMSFRPAISAHDPAQDYYADEDMMEVTPYAQGYRWPAGATYEPTTGVNGQSSGENVALTASTPISRISAEDIDAFMRINPGDNPFNMAE